MTMHLISLPPAPLRLSSPWTTPTALPHAVSIKRSQVPGLSLEEKSSMEPSHSVKALPSPVTSIPPPPTPTRSVTSTTPGNQATLAHHWPSTQAPPLIPLSKSAERQVSVELQPLVLLLLSVARPFLATTPPSPATSG